MRQLAFILLLWMFTFLQVNGQSYTSTYGSAYAGSTGIRNNPSASVNAAYKWDLTFLTVQAKVSTNSLFMRNDSVFLTHPFKNRFLHNNADFSIMNFLYKPNNKHAFALNLRGRTYNHIRTEPLVASDSIYDIRDFLIQNRTTPYLEGFATHTGWLEADLNYSRIIHESYNSKLTGGITVQVMRGISGAFARINKLSYLETKTSTDTIYNFLSGGSAFGYSSNYDESPSGTTSASQFVKNSLTGLGFSIGAEYLLYGENNNSYQQNNAINYQWKIGVALMDLGANKFKSGEFGGQYRNIDPTITDNDLDNKFMNIESGRDLRDSLATVFTVAENISNRFKIGNPTRLVINVDRAFGNNIYVNTDLSINLHGTSGFRRLLSREVNLLTVTPRWETLNWGFYLPIQYNSQNQFHIGAAFKAGPLVLGLHNLQWVKQIKNLSGGGYLMLSIHPFNKRKVISKLDCPE